MHCDNSSRGAHEKWLQTSSRLEHRLQVTALSSQKQVPFPRRTRYEGKRTRQWCTPQPFRIAAPLIRIFGVPFHPPTPAFHPAFHAYNERGRSSVDGLGLVTSRAQFRNTCRAALSCVRTPTRHYVSLNSVFAGVHRPAA